MNIRDFSKPMSVDMLNESMAKKFGSRVDVNRFTTEELYDARNRIRTKLSQIQTTESYDSVQQDHYQKNKMFLDVINAELDRRMDESPIVTEAVITQNPEDVAEIVMAAKDMVDRLTGWMEDTSEMETDSMLDLADSIREALGEKMADDFTSSVRPSLYKLYSMMDETRKVLNQGVEMLSGTIEPKPTLGDDDEGDLGSGEREDEEDVDLDLDLDLGDDFEASGAASGGEEEEGREKRESRSFSKKKI